MFVVIPSKSSFNALLGKDRIHAVEAIPSTLHQFFISWNDAYKVETVKADDNPNKLQQLHLDFKMYDP